MVKLLLVVALLAMVSGCGGVDAVPQAVPDPPSTPPASTETAPPVESTSPEEDPPALEAECVDGEHLAFGFWRIGAALGSRHLTVTVINCTEEPVPIPGSVPVAATDGQGDVVPLAWQWREPPGDGVIAPGETRYLHLKWRTSGRCERGATVLSVRVDDSGATREDCFQMGGLDGAEGGEALWSAEPSTPL